ncbi:MAG: RraA family protein [Planctomycetaceae bacterium]|nr:RraA family protein [Planctomycetaceae bacterium]
MSTPLTASDLAALREFDTPTICNVIELFNVRPRNTGYMNHHIKAAFPKMPPMVGFALTSTFRSMAAPRGGDAYASIVKQLEVIPSLPGPAVIVFQDLDEPTAAATFGEVMCTTYKAFGSTGLITSGTGRDLDQVERIGYPVFTSGANCSHGYCHILQVGLPVSVGGITVFQGDLLHGDLNGVTTIPIEIARAIPEGCRELAAAENIILDYLKGPGLTAKGLDDARKACGDAIAKLGKRLRGDK